MRITSPAPGMRVPLEEIDLYDPEGFRSGCQHAAWQTLRTQAPVWWQETPNGAGFWSVTRYADCDRLLKDHRVFSSEHGTILASVGLGDAAGGQAMTVTDPPVHGVLSRPVRGKLSRGVVGKSSGQMASEIESLIAPILSGAETDFAHVLRQMPMAMLAPMMGIPRDLRAEVGYWSAVSIAPNDPELTGGLSPDVAARQAHHELFALFSEAIRASRKEPGNDVMTALATLTLGGGPLTDERVMLNCYSLVMGAHATTPHVATQTLLVLMERPDLWNAVRRDPSLIPALVEEGTRWTSPTHHLVRRATEDTVVAGVRIAAGDWVCGWVGSANRDPLIWPDPYTFRLDRKVSSHLGFGAGAHYCIGSHVSRAALTLLFGLLSRRVRRFELVAEPTHILSNWINGITRMNVAVELEG